MFPTYTIIENSKKESGVGYVCMAHTLKNDLNIYILCMFEVGRKRENLFFFVAQEKPVNLVSRPKTGLDTRFTSIFCATRKTKFSRFLPTSYQVLPKIFLLSHLGVLKMRNNIYYNNIS